MPMLPECSIRINEDKSLFELRTDSAELMAFMTETLKEKNIGYKLNGNALTTTVLWKEPLKELMEWEL